MSHAVLSPSGASRWMACTPSARLEQSYPDNASDAAAEGTLAHKIGENMILRELKILSQYNYDKELVELKKKVGKDGKTRLYKPEMQAYCEAYKDYVIEQYNNALFHTSDAEIHLEKQIDMSDYVPEGFGTGDVQIIADDVLDFIDLKYGKGVPVTAEWNEQLMLYGLGALRAWDLIYNIKRVRLHIFQPRLDSVTVFEISADELRAWGEEKVKPLAKKAFAGEGEFNPGEKQCKFCRVRATCKAFADYNMQVTKFDLQNPNLLSPEQIAEILGLAKTFVGWIEDVQEHALNEAVHNGARWPGYKLVAGRSNRKYGDPKKVAVELNRAGIQDFWKPMELKGITDMTALLGKKKFDEIIGPLLVKPRPAPTLVPESDKREEWSSATDAFADLEIAD